MTAKELIENNSLTNIEVTGEQAVVFAEIAMTAVNMAREEGANALIEQASNNGQKKYQQGVDFMKYRAIEIYKKTCDFNAPGCCACKNAKGECDCEQLKDFIAALD